MFKRFRLTIIIAFAAIAAGCAFAACGQYSPYQSALDNGYSASVTYYSSQLKELPDPNNEGGTIVKTLSGRFNGSRSTARLTLLYQDGKPVYEIGESRAEGSSTNVPVASCSGYVLDGWHYVMLGQDGQPMFQDQDGNAVVPVLNEDGSQKTDRNLLALYTVADGAQDEELTELEVYPVVDEEAGKVDFETLRTEEKTSYYLCANWVQTVKINYILVADEGTQITEKDSGTVYVNGNTIGTSLFGDQSIVYMSNYEPSNVVSSEDYTFVAYYLDKECTQIASYVDKPATEEDVDIYVKYLTGKWTVVKTAGDVESMFSGLNGRNNRYYLLKDIDCSTANIALKTPTYNFRATIQGDGHKLSNLSVSYTAVKAGDRYSLFGTFGDSAVIDGLTLENLSVTIGTATGGFDVYGICSGVTEGAQLAFAVDGFALNVPAAAYCSENSYLFGGYDKDDDFLNTFTNVTVTNAQLVKA